MNWNQFQNQREDGTVFYQNRIAETIRILRTERGWNQKELADRLGVTVQAVSKWETDNGLPDVLMLPEIAATFGISMDELFFGKDAAEPEPSVPPSPAPAGQYFPDDGVIRVAQFRGSTLLRADDADAKEICLVVPGDLSQGPQERKYEFFANVTCGDIAGNVAANGSINCGNVFGSVSGNSHIACGEIYGSVTTDGGDVCCGNVTGCITTDSGDVNCGDVGGCITTDSGDVSCGDVGGGITTDGGDISCGDIGGDVSVDGGKIEQAGTATEDARQKAADARQKIQDAIEQINHHPESVTCKGKPLSADITESVKRVLEAAAKRLERFEKK